jgi:hypothetical protein
MIKILWYTGRYTSRGKGVVESLTTGCTHILGLLLKIVDIHLLSTCKFSFLPSCLYSLCFVVISQSSCYLELSSLLIYIPTIFWRCCSIISARSCLLRPKSVSVIFLPLVTSDCNKPEYEYNHQIPWTWEEEFQGAGKVWKSGGKN